MPPKAWIRSPSAAFRALVAIGSLQQVAVQRQLVRTAPHSMEDLGDDLSAITTRDAGCTKSGLRESVVTPQLSLVDRHGASTEGYRNPQDSQQLCGLASRRERSVVPLTQNRSGERQKSYDGG